MSAGWGNRGEKKVMAEADRLIEKLTIERGGGDRLDEESLEPRPGPR